MVIRGKDVVILGVGMTKCGKFPDLNLKSLVKSAFESVTADAGIDKKQIQAVYMGNVHSGMVSDQILLKGQVWMAPLGFSGTTIVNTEEACATSHSAIYLGYLDVAAGEHDCVLVIGAEKSSTPDRDKFLWWTNAARDVDEPPPVFKTEEQSVAGQEKKKIGGAAAAAGAKALDYMAKTGLTETHVAKICVKNHYNASLNPYAMFPDAWSLEQVMNSRVISYPMRLPMMANICDGSGALILCSADFARRYTTKPIYLLGTVLRLGIHPEAEVLDGIAGDAYERAGLGPEDVDIWELMDTSTMDEIQNYARFGICKPEESVAMIDRGDTALTGRFPVNTSGGLEGRGHPAGCTGIDQITEQVWQFRGIAGKRQVTKQNLKVGLSHIAGGGGPCVSIIKR